MHSCKSQCASYPTNKHFVRTVYKCGSAVSGMHVPHCTQWPSQQRHKMLHNVVTAVWPQHASLQPTQQNWISQNSELQLQQLFPHPACMLSSSSTQHHTSSCSNRVGRSHHSKHPRTAVVSFSLGNGGSSSSSSRQQPLQMDGSQSWQALSQQQQQQQQFPQSANGSRLLQQRRAVTVREQQQQQQQWQYHHHQQQQIMQGYGSVDDSDQDLIYPRLRFVAKSFNRVKPEDWYEHLPINTDPQTLQAAVLQRCGRGQIETAAVKQLMIMAASPRDAQMVLSTVAAVRAVAVSQGKMQPWPDPFLKQFVKMCVTCDCHEVLVSAMQRPTELGFMFKWKGLLVALKHWGDLCEVDKLQQIAIVMEDAGLMIDERMAYVVLRAAVNAHCDLDRINTLLTWFEGKGVGRDRFRPTLIRLLEKAGIVAAAAAAAEGDGNAAAAAAAAAAADALADLNDSEFEDALDLGRS